MLREIKTEKYQIQLCATALQSIVTKTWKSPNNKKNVEQLKSILETSTKSPRKSSTLLAMVSSLPPEDQPVSNIP